MKLLFKPQQIFLTIDMEQDCPPYLNTYRGIAEGLNSLLSLLQEENVMTTFFVSGQIAKSFPDTVRNIINSGHEVGSHGYNHSDYTSLDRKSAQKDIDHSLSILRQFCSVCSFRAPYLKFPQSYLSLLQNAGISVDSSQAKYKLAYLQKSPPTKLLRIPASITSSVLRLPDWLRNPWLGALKSPVVLFVHPWEFVDLRTEKIPLDCRFNTGSIALDCLREVIHFYKKRGFQFRKMQDLLTDRKAASRSTVI
jgi:peptidoglycan/xylan/chitin deacetylase (PgdA/CDA1 family)